MDPEAWTKLLLATADAQHWAWTCRLQCDRVEADRERARAMPGDFSDPSRRAASQQSADGHMLLISCGNLVKAVHRLEGLTGDRLPLPRPFRQTLTLVRNVFEHWDKQRLATETGRQSAAVARLASHEPDAMPGTLSWTPQDGIVIAGVLRVTDFLALLSELDTELAERWANVHNCRPAKRSSARPT